MTNMCLPIKHKTFLLILASILAFPLLTNAQNKISIEILPGFATALPSKLLIQQEGFNDIELKARYDVESFDLPIYYSIRAGYSLNEELSLELELNHLKLYLANAPAEIQWFSISHGYNQLWFNLLRKRKHFDIRAGIGPVIAHPESEIRNKKFDENGGLGNRGYYLSGLTGQLGLQKKIPLSKHIFLSAETKINISYSQIKVADGFANVSVYAFHGLMGVGAKF